MYSSNFSTLSHAALICKICIKAGYGQDYTGATNFVSFTCYRYIIFKNCTITSYWLMTKSVNGEHTNWEVIHMHPAKWEHTQEDFWYFWRHSRLLSFSNIFFAKLSSKLKPVKALFLLSFFLSLRLCLS